MKTVCKNCSYENEPEVSYCQRCGQHLTRKFSLKQEVKSWDLRGLAGVGRKDVNIAPLFTAAPTAETKHSNAKVDPLPDGRWYCPDCGTLHFSNERFCRNCGKAL